jgi:hypothetical protein
METSSSRSYTHITIAGNAAISMRSLPLLSEISFHFGHIIKNFDRLCGLVVRVPGNRYRGLSSIPGATRVSEK